MLKGASATLLLTLAARAAASRVVPELAFVDACAEHLARHSPYDLASYAHDPGFVRGVVLRSAIMDGMAQDFFARHPGGTAVSLGAGLCTRRQRLVASGVIDAPQTWLHVDLPDVIALRRSLMPEQEGERDIACSLLDETEWLPEVDPRRPTLFLLEGVCPYLPETPLRDWFARMAMHGHLRTTACEMALDFIDPELLKMSTQVGDMNLPLQSAFAGVDAFMAMHADARLRCVHTPFARFSSGHAQFEAGIRAQTGRPLYTVVHLELATRHGPA
jgi:O-methyltransferase involved in polyketide biosynthesis